MKNFLLFALLFFIVACSRSKVNNDVTSESIMQDSLATLIIKSDLGIGITISDNKETKNIFMGKNYVTSDTVLNIKTLPLDLLIAGDHKYSKIADSILIKPGDSIEINLIQNGTKSFYLRKGNKIPASWSRENILPIDTSYKAIAEMKSVIRSFLLPPPPSFESSENEKAMAKKAYDEFERQKKDYKALDHIKKNYTEYSRLIDTYYNNALQNISADNDSLKIIFNKSFIIWAYYQDLNMLYVYTQQPMIAEKMKELCDYNVSIKGQFSDNQINRHFKLMYLINNRKMSLTTVYDSIVAQEFKTHEQVFKKLIIETMQMPFVNYPRQDIITYIDKYVMQYGSDKKIDELKENIEYDKKVVSDLNLEALDGTITTFEKLREQYKGSVLYVDFWASWCGPCREAFPYSRKLREEFRAENVIFIYLAYNDKKNSWIEACKKENIIENSYRITNSKTSSFIKEMSINSIPRYMLYDTEGGLFQGTASHPDNIATREVLNKLILK